jgi:hypothetical protein
VVDKQSIRRLTCNDGTSNTRSVLGVVGDNVPAIARLVSVISQKRNIIADLDTHFPFSPKMSTKASWIRSANPGYFYQEDSRRISLLGCCNSRLSSGQTYVVKRPIGTDSTSFLEVPLLADNSGDTTGTQSSCTSTDQLGQVSEKDSLLQGGLETEEVGKDSDDGEELVSRVATRISTRSATEIPNACSRRRTHLSISDKKAVSTA